MELTRTVIAILLGYLLGSVPFAVVVSRAFGLADPRTYGSRNPGATNVLRSGNRVAALLTLIGDAAKGAVAVWLVRRFGPAFGVGEAGAAFAGCAAFAGHVFPLFLRFQGGKGVATFLGVLLALQPWIGVAACATWLVVAAAFRYSSLASLSASVVAPVAHAVVNGFDATLVAMALMTVVLFIRHKQNIANLRAGTEGRIGQKKTGAPAADRPH